MAEAGGYFASEARRGLPGELVLARIVLLGAAAAVVIMIVWDALFQGASAQWIGGSLGSNLATLAGALLALLIRPGRRWVRWLITAVGVIWFVPVVVYTVTGGAAYVGKAIVPAVLIVAVHLPAARRYFAEAP